MRKANVTHVSKKGKKVDAGNNRPVGDTSVPVKVMEQTNPGSHFQAHEGQGGNWE